MARKNYGVETGGSLVRHRARATLIRAFSLLFLIAPPVAAQTSEEGALFLLLPVGGQGVGLARAMTAVSGSGSPFWNPAGAVGIDPTRATIFRGDHIAGTVTGVSVLIGNREVRVFGLSYALLDSGTQDLTDDQGTVLGTISLRGHQGILTAAVPLGSRVRAGANLRWIQFRQSCRGQCPDAGVVASAYAVDLGTQIEPFSDRPLTVGVMIAHLGTPLRVSGSEQSNPLPARIRVGAAYVLSWDLVDEEIRLRVLTDLEDRLRHPGDPSVSLAAEVEAGSQDRIYLRGGYIFGNRSQVDGAGLGIGFRYERFEFDLARSLARGGPAIEGEPIHITLGIAL